MNVKRTLEEREKELQMLLATPDGRGKIQEIVASYSAASGKVMPSNSSPITYILVHERAQGLIGR